MKGRNPIESGCSQRRNKVKTDQQFHDLVGEYMGHIQLVYHRWADKKPVIELELPARRIGAYSPTEYGKTLSPRSRVMLKQDYALAKANHQIVVFIRDYDARTLRSSRIPIEPMD
jgi:hypothetical protein